MRHTRDGVPIVQISAWVPAAAHKDILAILRRMKNDPAFLGAVQHLMGVQHDASSLLKRAGAIVTVRELEDAA